MLWQRAQHGGGAISAELLLNAMNLADILRHRGGREPAKLIAPDVSPGVNQQQPRFAHVPPGPHLTLAGHTHGGQIRIPGIGVITNASKAPLRWSNGLISERGRYLYVTSGIGTSGVPLRWGVPPGYAILDVTGE
jgi:hypothetical protein